MAEKMTKTYNGYKPPFTMSARAVGIVADIAAQMERFAIRMKQSDALKLLKNGSPRAVVETNDERSFINIFIPVHEGCGKLVIMNDSKDVPIENCANNWPVVDYDNNATGDVPKDVPKENVSVPKEKSRVILNNTQAIIVDILRKNREATFDEISKLMGVSRKTIMRNIKFLKDNGFLERIGGRKEGYWKLNTFES